MLDELIVLHSGNERNQALAVPLRGLQWQTCLRKILFLRDGEIDLPSLTTHSEEVFRGESAYQFLLEVVCGLNSPLVGETAVMGQFRDFCAQAKFPATSWGWFLRQFMSEILVDAKHVRHEHLQGLGSQSYGGLVRRHVAEVSTAAVLGSGQLAEEILPWLIGKTNVRLFYRNRSRAEKLVNTHSQLQIDDFETASDWNNEPAALIVAAPVSSCVIETWIKKQNVRFSKVLDLRGEALTDRLQASVPVIELSEMFARLNSDRHKLNERASIARAAIRKLSEGRAKQAHFRPFGWEDLCA